MVTTLFQNGKRWEKLGKYFDKIFIPLMLQDKKRFEGKYNIGKVFCFRN